jgi:Flp pilus assembly pilin Flp
MGISMNRAVWSGDRGLGLIRRFLVEDGAQDLVEYGLLAAFLATAGAVALNAIGPAVASTYASWMDPNTGTPSLWAPPEPASGGS